MGLDGVLEAAIRERIEDLFEEAERARGIMGPERAAEFLDMTPNEFKKVAPKLPRHAVSPRRFLYLADELREWVRRQPERPE